MRKLALVSLAALTLAVAAAGSVAASSDDRNEYRDYRYNSKKYCNHNSERCEHGYRHEDDDDDDGYRHNRGNRHHEQTQPARAVPLEKTRRTAMRPLVAPHMLGLVPMASPALASGNVGNQIRNYDQYGISSAACRDVARDQWMSFEAVKTRAAELGFKALDISSLHGCLQVRGTDKDGAEATFLMHPVSGAIVKPEGRL